MAVVESVLVNWEVTGSGEVPLRKTSNFYTLAFILLNSAKDALTLFDSFRRGQEAFYRDIDTTHLQHLSSLLCVGWLTGDTQVEVLI